MQNTSDAQVSTATATARVSRSRWSFARIVVLVIAILNILAGAYLLYTYLTIEMPRLSSGQSFDLGLPLLGIALIIGSVILIMGMITRAAWAQRTAAIVNLAIAVGILALWLVSQLGAKSFEVGLLVVSLIGAAIAALVGVGLLRDAKWARGPAVVLQCLYALIVIIATLSLASSGIDRLLFLSLGVIDLVIGVALLMRKGWARVAAIAFYWLDLFAVVFLLQNNAYMIFTFEALMILLIVLMSVGSEFEQAR